MQDIQWSLALPVEQEKVLDFLTDTGNAQRIDRLVEDIHEGLMEYQVCVLTY